jgi:hypothetical protein
LDTQQPPFSSPNALKQRSVVAAGLKQRSVVAAGMQPTKFHMAINTKTAKSLGIELPPDDEHDRAQGHKNREFEGAGHAPYICHRLLAIADKG